jgi:hypothetical protein
LESYHLYLQPQKVSKNPKKFAFTAACPKSLNSIYGTLRPLRVNFKRKITLKIKESLKTFATWHLLF